MSTYSGKNTFVLLANNEEKDKDYSHYTGPKDDITRYPKKQSIQSMSTYGSKNTFDPLANNEERDKDYSHYTGPKDDITRYPEKQSIQSMSIYNRKNTLDHVGPLFGCDGGSHDLWLYNNVWSSGNPCSYPKIDGMPIGNFNVDDYEVF